MQKLTGPIEWADGLATDRRGLLLVTQNDETFELSVWDLSDLEKIGQRITLAGTNTAKYFPLTGANDAIVITL